MSLSRFSVVLITSIAPLIWGSTYLVTTQWLPENSPLLASAVRSLPVGIVLVLVSRQWLKGDWWWKAFVLGMLNIGLFFICLFSAAYLMPGGVASILLATQPLWSLFLAAWLLGDRMAGLSVLQALMGLTGVLLLVGDTNGGLNRMGVIVALLGAASMALGVVLAKKWQRPESISLIGLTGWQLLFAGIVLFPLAFWFEGVPVTLSLSEALGFLYLAVPGAMLCYCLWFYGIQRLPTSTVVILGFISPLTANVLGYFWLDEQFNAIQWLGVFTIALTLLLPTLLGIVKRLLVMRSHQLSLNED